MASQDFQVLFDGPAVAEGRMAVRDLAPSLLALGELFDLAKENVEPDLPELALEVRAFRPGSFDNLLGLAFDASVALLVADPTTAVTNLLTIVTHGKNGLLAVTRTLRGRKLVDLQPTDQRDYSLGKNNQGNQIIAPNSVFNLYADERAFEMLATFFHPLREKPGYERVEVTNPVEPFIATREEIQEMPAAEEEAPEPVEGREVARSERTTVLSIVNAPIQHPVEHKWRLNEGMDLADIWAKVTHAKWLDDLANHREHLDIGDRIKCRLAQIQKETEKGLQVEYEVVEVLEHLGPPPRGEQGGLFNE